MKQKALGFVKARNIVSERPKQGDASDDLNSSATCTGALRLCDFACPYATNRCEMIGIPLLAVTMSKRHCQSLRRFDVDEYCF